MPRNRDETQVQDQIIRVVRTLGYLVYHTHDSRRSEKGFPDICIVGFDKLIFIEFKAGKNTATKEQQQWLDELNNAGVDARLYHVDTWKSGDRRLIDELIFAKRQYRMGRRTHGK